MAQLGLDFNLKNVVVTVLILVIVSFCLGYYMGGKSAPTGFEYKRTEPTGTESTPTGFEYKKER